MERRNGLGGGSVHKKYNRLVGSMDYLLPVTLRLNDSARDDQTIDLWQRIGRRRFNILFTAVLNAQHDLSLHIALYIFYWFSSSTEMVGAGLPHTRSYTNRRGASR